MEDKVISYQINAIEVLDLTIGRRPEGFQGKMFTFDVHTNARVNPEKGTIIIIVEVLTKEPEKDETLAKITVAMSFIVDGFKESILQNEEGLYVIPGDFEQLLSKLAITTTRGIMYANFKGSYLHKAVLPLVFLTEKNKDSIDANQIAV